MNTPWPLDHVAHAVTDLDKAIDLYRNQFGFQLESRETLKDHGIEVAFLKLENTKIELITPLLENSTTSNFIQTRGEGLHHICFRVPDVEKELKRLADQGVQLIDTTPRIGYGGKMIGFIHPKSCGGVLIELCSGGTN